MSNLQLWGLLNIHPSLGFIRVSFLFVRHSFYSDRVQGCWTPRQGWSISLFLLRLSLWMRFDHCDQCFICSLEKLFGTLSWRLRRPPNLRLHNNAHTTAVTDCLKVSTCIIWIQSKLVMSAGAGLNSNIFREYLTYQFHKPTCARRMKGLSAWS